MNFTAGEGLCSGGALFATLWLLGLGGYAIWRSVRAWRPGGADAIAAEVEWMYPSRETAGPVLRFFRATREDRYAMTVRSDRVAIVFGVLCTGIALWLASGELRCVITGFEIPPLLGPLAFRFWWPMVPFVALMAAFGIAAGYTKPWPQRILVIAALTAWGVAAGEAAEFHTGIQAARWGALVFGSVIVAALVCVIVRARRSRTTSAS